MGSAKNLALDTIIFDLDGTLHNLVIDHEKVRRSLPLASPDEKLGDAVQRLRLANDPRLDIVTAAELASIEGQSLSEEIVATLSSLQSYNLAILTRNSRKAAEQLLKNTTGADKVFIVGREDTVQLKPHHEGIERILSHFHTAAERTALIGDTSHDVIAAKNGNIMSIIVKNESLKFAPVGADYYIDTLAALLSLLRKS